MIVEFTKRFRKDFRQVAIASGIAESVQQSVENVYAAASVSDIKNIKKLAGFKNYFRIRIGDYRIGLKIEGDIVIFSAIQHRKDIYKKFP